MKSIVFAAASVLALLVSCAQTVRPGEKKIQVFVSIVPQQYFLKRIGGKRVIVRTLVKPGDSPETYEPTPRQMAALSDAKLYFRIGVPFEHSLMPKIKGMMKHLRIVDTRKGIKLRTMKSHLHQVENGIHANGHHAGEEGMDPHIWLSPQLVKIQARTIADALIEIDPANRSVYEKNLSAFIDDLNALNAKLAKALAPVRGRSFLVFHPAWGYFADAYGLNQEAIEIEGKVPSSKQLVRIIEKAKHEEIKVIFVQPQVTRISADKVAESIGGAVVPIDPLAADYIQNLEKVANVVSSVLEKQK